MEKIGFWQSVFNENMSGVERDKLNEAATAINNLSLQNNHVWRQVQKLFSLDKAQSDELSNLRVMVRVLTEALLDAGHLDRTLLNERMKTAFTELELSRNPKVAAQKSPYRDGGGQETTAEVSVKAEPTTSCPMCGETVLARLTTITEQGVICDSCFANLSPS